MIKATRTRSGPLPIVILEVDGDCIPFFADAKRSEYRAVDDPRIKYRADEINAPMAEVVERSAVTVH